MYDSQFVYIQHGYTEQQTDLEREVPETNGSITGGRDQLLVVTL